MKTLISLCKAFMKQNVEITEAFMYTFGCY